MKIVARIFGIITILFALLTCSVSIYSAGVHKEKTEKELIEARQQMDEFKAQAATTSGETKAYLDEKIATAEKMISEAPSGSTYLIVQIFLAVLLVLTIVFAYLLFKPNMSLVTKLVVAAVLVAVIVYFASPDIKRGQHSGFEDRTFALISGIPVVVAGLFALLVAKKSRANQVNTNLQPQ
ncbi:hypothetical protein [Flavobacterium silvaticum]|uniref:Uncharacterized protein n=1 Tax=Flavobacterium silvaticum TaxID=1852020 RepID=A0A972FMX5_9FLAO|nr:hypothetical protein [Flavobacterium silvaticum]NMH28637.1 hypothetical protein [Flavobacterium silvaticum]